MARNAWPTVFTGDAWSAAQQNTYGRDNDAAYWVYTTKGDLAICSSPNTLRRQPVGQPGQVLRTNSAGDDWETGWANLPFCKVKNSTNQNLLTTETTLVWDTDIKDDFGWHDTSTNNHLITPNIPGEYIAALAFFVAGVGGSGTAMYTLNFNTPIGKYAERFYPPITAYDKQRIFVTPPFSCNGTTDSFWWTIEQNEGGTRVLRSSSYFSMIRIGD